jgi:hypothetical protein
MKIKILIVELQKYLKVRRLLVGDETIELEDTFFGGVFCIHNQLFLGIIPRVDLYTIVDIP